MAASGEASVRAVLVGGPDSLPEDARLQAVSPLSDKIKLAHHGGYEHFERSSELPGPDADFAVTFRWTMRTRAAE